MINIFNQIKDRAKDLIDFRYTRKSFSQFGEDLIIGGALNIIKEKKFSCLDIGINQPYLINNSYYFYRKGKTATLIELDPLLCKN